MLLKKYTVKNACFTCIWTKIFCRKCSTSYKNTLLLPVTRFQHRIKHQNRRNVDSKIEQDAKFANLFDYQKQVKKKQEFILHDGPPYANGDVHIGHAVNKILKDITLRYQLIKGHPVHFIPGWDCHGLPIELKVLKENDVKSSKIDIRKQAYAFSQEAKEKQKHSFLEWGLLSNFQETYLTCDPKYIAKQLNAFQDLYDKGIIYRDHKPVFWSPYNRTSLAEAELEYNKDHVSLSVFMKFHLKKYPDILRTKLAKNSKLSIVIWTTTPWTLPANQAVCYSSEKQYCIVSCEGKDEYYIIALEMLPSLEKVLKTKFEVLEVFEGSLLSDVTYSHPLAKNRECPLLPAYHVTMDKGTGLVHMAPNHGLDDFIVAKKQNLFLDPCIVNESGCYNENAGPDLEGQSVLESGSQTVLSLIKNNVLHMENYVHSYPYDWRSKTPVIIRSSHQWFFDVDQIRDRAIECLQSVQIIPENFKKVFQIQLENCPQWCISRQRAWGVPIPAFYSCATNEPLVHRDLTNHLCNLIQKSGIHCWWEMDTSDLLPQNLKSQLQFENETFEKGTDILDIWFDSGVSWRCVLPEPQVSDICIEGLDQIRGWFNSSIMTSVAVRGIAPYKSLFLHGFVTDSEGRKMSKSEGNVINPNDILDGSKSLGIPAYGIDVLRWWVANHACQADNVPVKMNIIEDCAQNLFKIRNVFKFLLANVNDYDIDSHIIPADELRSLDLYTLHMLKQFRLKVMKYYNQMQYKNASKEILTYIVNDVSAFYCHLVKDRLYCEAQFSKDRLQCQTVLNFILITLMQLISPICPHLIEEAHSYSPNYKDESIFISNFPSLDEFLLNTHLPESVLFANAIRGAILTVVNNKTSHLDAIILCSPRISKSLQNLNANLTNDSGLTETFQTSTVSIQENPDSLPKGYLKVDGTIDGFGRDEKFSVVLMETKLKKCPRCRLYNSSSESILCDRCTNVINICTSSKHSSVC